MTGIGDEIRRDYREVRRYRSGFHAHRQPGLSKQRRQLQEEYTKKRKAYIADYRNVVERVREKNLEERRKYESLMEQWDKEHATYLTYKKKFGAAVAERYSHADVPNSVSKPSKPTQEKPPTYEDYIENFDGYRSHVRHKRGLPNLNHGELFRLGKKMQYETIVNVEACFVEGSARQSLYRALAKCRTFQLSAERDPEGFKSLCEKKLVPINRSHAMPTTRLAKLIVGESVRVPITRKKYSRPHKLIWFWDDKLVNKIATMLMLFSEEEVAPEKVPDWIRDRGGMQACLKRKRR